MIGGRNPKPWGKARFPFSMEQTQCLTGEWMATSAVKRRCLFDPHHLHVMSPSFLTRIDLDCVAAQTDSISPED